MNEDGNRPRSSDSKSVVDTLKNEWSLFWDSISGDFVESEAPDAFQTGRLQVLSLDQVREITRALSKNRKQVNQKIESLNKELELNSVKLETLRLVGAEEDDTVKRIHELSDQGQALSQELSQIDDRLKIIRQTEDRLKKKSKTV